MKIKLIAIGSKMPSWVNEGFEEYQKRLAPQHQLTLKEIPLQKRSKGADNSKQIAKETELMCAAIPKNSLVIALDRAGKDWSSEQLADQLNQWQQTHSEACILIGGPEGFSEKIFEVVDTKWSLSKLTLPHPIVRIVLSEQLYRANSILNKHPYHR